MTIATFLRSGAIVLTLFVAAVPAAQAQAQNRFAIGLGAASRAATGGAPVHGVGSPGIIWRIGHSKPGWHPTFGLNWFSANVGDALGSSFQQFARVNVKPLMVGYGYTRMAGRAALSANVLAGYSIASVRLSDQGSHVFTAKIRGGLVMNPELSLWVNLSKKIGLNLNANCMIARPRLTLANEFGSVTDRVRADMLMFKVGVVYSIF